MQHNENDLCFHLYLYHMLNFAHKEDYGFSFILLINPPSGLIVWFGYKGVKLTEVNYISDFWFGYVYVKY